VRQIEVRAFEKVQRAVKARLMVFREVFEKSKVGALCSEAQPSSRQD
jgi:hypothetical protein